MGTHSTSLLPHSFTYSPLKVERTSSVSFLISTTGDKFRRKGNRRRARKRTGRRRPLLLYITWPSPLWRARRPPRPRPCSPSSRRRHRRLLRLEIKEGRIENHAKSSVIMIIVVAFANRDKNNRFVESAIAFSYALAVAFPRPQ